MAYPYYPYQSGFFQPPQMPGNQAPMDQLSQLRQQQVQPMQQPAQQGGGILWVQGEEGAKAYMVAPGSSVLLMDSENSSFYIKSSDASGMPQPLRVFDYQERTASRPAPATEYVTRAEFNEFAARLNARAAHREKEDVIDAEPLV